MIQRDSSMFRDRTVLVTGGTGSIGSEVVRRILDLGPRTVRVLSRDDSKQFELAQELRGRPELRMLIGDVRSRERVGRAMSGVDLVVHAAAMKHVPACEFNPFEATETNVRGTQNVVEAAIDAGVERVLTVSTDKAVDPTNVMGATKLLAERLMSSAELYKGPASTRFASVRFGNVIGSRGSIVPLVLGQVARGGPVTVTDPEMTRYVMPLRTAVGLCLTAIERMEGGEVFILKMPRIRVGDLVEVLIEAYAGRFGYRPDEIAVERIGVRAGEKLHEALMTADESDRAFELGEMWVVPGAATGDRPRPATLPEPGSLLDRDGLKDLLDSAGWLTPESILTLT
ncbi:MAG: SDR family NAD(P)-dependent oxidoreductase [Candidatus Limnocylindria bacterium]